MSLFTVLIIVLLTIDIFIWNNTIDNYSSIIQTLDLVTRSYSGITITKNGSKIIVVDYDYVYYALWNGTNYGPFIQTKDIIKGRNYKYITCILYNELFINIIE